jgi:hypothetical protein
MVFALFTAAAPSVSATSMDSGDANNTDNMSCSLMNSSTSQQMAWMSGGMTDMSQKYKRMSEGSRRMSDIYRQMSDMMVNGVMRGSNMLNNSSGNMDQNASADMMMNMSDEMMNISERYDNMSVACQRMSDMMSGTGMQMGANMTSMIWAQNMSDGTNSQMQNADQEQCANVSDNITTSFT